jgi:hypothetical protein
MGANAQTTVPSFVAAQTLTAEQMNQSARTGVPVFADSSARDSSFGGTGEKTLAEGQLCYLEDSNVVQYYDGSSWATVGPQTITTPGLVRISTTTATSGSSLNITNAFSSTYNTYLIVIDDLLYNTGGGVLRMTLGATATGYYWGCVRVSYGAGTVTTDFGNNTTSFTIGQGDNTYRSGMVVTVTNPNLAATTGINSLAMDPRTTESTMIWQGYVNNSTQYTDFTLTPGSSRTFANVSVKVYGYAQ